MSNTSRWPSGASRPTARCSWTMAMRRFRSRRKTRVWRTCSRRRHADVMSRVLPSGIGNAEAARRTWQPIGDDGLLGATDARFVYLMGSCGNGHTLNHRNARKLRDWLDTQLGIEGSAVDATDADRLAPPALVDARSRGGSG